MNNSSQCNSLFSSSWFRGQVFCASIRILLKMGRCALTAGCCRFISKITVSRASKKPTADVHPNGKLPQAPETAAGLLLLCCFSFSSGFLSAFVWLLFLCLYSHLFYCLCFLSNLSDSLSCLLLPSLAFVSSHCLSPKRQWCELALWILTVGWFADLIALPPTCSRTQGQQSPRVTVVTESISLG